MVWQNNWRVRSFRANLTTGRGESLVEQLNQFFAFNTCITCTQIETSWESGASKGGAGLLVNLLYTQPYGIQYFAAEFRSSSTKDAGRAADEFFDSNPAFRAILTADLTPPETRYTNDERLLIIYARASEVLDQDIFALRGAVPGEEIPVGEYRGAADDVDPTRTSFPLHNLGEDVWPEGTPSLAVKYPGFGNLWMGIGPTTYPSVASDPVTPSLPSCAYPELCPDVEPPPSSTFGTTTPPWTLTTSTTTTTPPPRTLPQQSTPPQTTNPTEPNCHRTVYTCDCNSSNESEWVLDTNECIPNWQCSDPNGTGFVIWCSEEEWERNVIDGCAAGGGVPAAPTPPLYQENADGTGESTDECEPECCDPKCHKAVYECICNSYDEPEWELISNECVDNDDCNSYAVAGEPYIECSSEDYTYELKDGCDPGDEVPDEPGTNKANGDPCEPDCCDTKCHKFVYNCVPDEYDSGESLWELDSNECVDNDDCSSSGSSGEAVITCSDEQYTYELRDGCEAGEADDPPDAVEPTDDECEPSCNEGWSIDTIYFTTGITSCDKTANGDFDPDCQVVDPTDDVDAAARAAMDGLYTVDDVPGTGGSDPCTRSNTCCDANWQTDSTVVNEDTATVVMSMDDEDPPDDWNDGTLTISLVRC